MRCVSVIFDALMEMGVFSDKDTYSAERGNMRFTNVNDINSFIGAVGSCKQAVWLTNHRGKNYNLKSALSLYVGIADLIGENAEDYEIFCDSRDDERYMIRYFMNRPQ